MPRTARELKPLEVRRLQRIDDDIPTAADRVTDILPISAFFGSLETVAGGKHRTGSCNLLGHEHSPPSERIAHRI